MSDWKENFPKENRYYETENGILYLGDALEILNYFPENSVNTVVTSPPYNKCSKRRFRITKGTKWKKTNFSYDEFDDCVEESLYREQQKLLISLLLRSLTTDGSIFYNHKVRQINNDTYHPIEWLHTFIIREEIIWNRKSTPNISNRKFNQIDERIYWITKIRKTPKFYKYRSDFKSTIWTFHFDSNTEHPAPFPKTLPHTCIITTTDEYDIILDPYFGSGTVGVVAEELGRRWIGIEINKRYCDMAIRRLQ